MRHTAWLNAMPEASKTSRLDTEKKPLSRLEQLRVDRKDAGFNPDMPPVAGAHHLIDYLWEVGPVMAGGMALAPIAFAEIDAWQRMTAVPLHPWEARFLRRLSRDYIEASREAESADCPPPWSPVDLSEEDRAAVSAKVRNTMRDFIFAKRKPT